MLQISFIIPLFFILFLKSSLYLGVVLGVLILISIKQSLKLITRVLKSIIFFNLGITISYLIMGIFKNMEVMGYLLYINLKVLQLPILYFGFLVRLIWFDFSHLVKS